MAHELDGDWTSFVVNDDEGVIPESFITLKSKANGDLDTGSERKDNAGNKHTLTGKISPGAGKHNIAFADDTASYDGAKLLDIDLGGGKKITLIGGVKILNHPLKLAKIRGRRVDGQEEGTWVATKQG